MSIIFTADFSERACEDAAAVWQAGGLLHGQFPPPQGRAGVAR